MEKLSSILPKSPRTQNVDNSKAQPARPGAPLLGRPAGRVTQKVMFDDPIETQAASRTAPDLSFADKFSTGIPADKVSLSESSMDGPALSNYTRKGDLAKVKIAEDVSRKFANLEALPKEDVVLVAPIEGDNSKAEAVMSPSQEEITTSSQSS